MDVVTTSSRPALREQRSDAAANHVTLLRAATAAIHREGQRVPMATIAAEAGVGIGTLYRHFPVREQLLTELTHRSFEQVLVNAELARRDAPNGLEAIRRFIQAAIDQRDELLLPLHGGPPVTASRTTAIQAKVHCVVDQMIGQGLQDGSIVHEVPARDIIVFGAMLAQPRRSDPAWTATGRRLLDRYLDGLGAPRRSG